MLLIQEKQIFFFLLANLLQLGARLLGLAKSIQYVGRTQGV